MPNKKIPFYTYLAKRKLRIFMQNNNFETFCINLKGWTLF